ncbi:uncharacterized protein LOC116805923 [Drosophila grimshawi]|uniref:uncharacterized protein LOC116805923 n=1 Tax=Drosophila grimshawi TaxID=7222 RepID=UPI0013EF1615|nr:uncharacterized protein LOC116805923 [Drosophila grimshawi]
MRLARNIRLVLFLTNQLLVLAVLADIASVGHYSQTLMDSIFDIYASNNVSRHKLPALEANKNNSNNNDNNNNNLEPESFAPAFIYPYLMLALWITCITSIICCCVYCKCQHAERMAAYSSNSFELQEVHVLDHPLPHVKGCVCLACLQRQVARELQQRADQ